MSSTDTAVPQLQKVRREQLLIILVFAFFAFTMIYQLMHSALWGDEWVEYIISRMAIGSSEMHEEILLNFQPPLYNVVLHFWLGISDSLLWFRVFNIVIGMASGIFLFRTIKHLYNAVAASCSLIVLACCYQWIYCIQECSEYAMMLFFLFGALYFFTELLLRYARGKTILFILFCVGAMYSQYGAVFVVLPLLLFWLGHVLLGKEERKEKVFVFISYLIALFAFALPLYLVYMKFQMGRNDTFSADPISLSEMLRRLPVTPGRILGFLYCFEANPVDYEDAPIHMVETLRYATPRWQQLWSIAGIVFFVVFFFVLWKKRKDHPQRLILFTFLFAYILHFILTEIHVYAQIHAGMNFGFFSRYSYFYIPLFAVVLPVLVVEVYRSVKQNKFLRIGILGGVACLALVPCILSFSMILHNWEKASDDEFAEIWMREKGYEDMTFLMGYAEPGFTWYVSHHPEYQKLFPEVDAADFITRESVPADQWPDRFWLWRSNWNGGLWPAACDRAREEGYDVKIFIDRGYAGQLAVCERRISGDGF